MTYQVTKTYGHNLGLSACFRQHRAKSHCRFLHGYPLSFKFTFEAETLDENNWVTDFGGLKPLKSWLESTFDHKMLIAEDDPELDTLAGLAGLGLADPLIVEDVGCEAFARMAYEAAVDILGDGNAASHLGWLDDRVRLVSVEVREHEANSAIYTGNGA